MTSTKLLNLNVSDYADAKHIFFIIFDKFSAVMNYNYI